MSVKPEDVLAESVNSLEIKGVEVRKGTVGAVLANAKIMASDKASMQEKINAKEMIKQLLPGLIALDLHKHIVWKNPEIQEMVDKYLKDNCQEFI